MKCETCKFWQYMDTYRWEPEDRKWGFCHRYPPSVHDNNGDELPIDTFPASEGTDWCGEYVGK